MASDAPVTAATVSADKPLNAPNVGDAEDESEWEYEYSTTETETYYLTVDLSIPQLLRRRRNAPVSGRGGYHYKHWAGPHKKPDEPKHHRILSDDENDDEPAPELEDDAEGDPNQMDANAENKNGGGDDADAESESDPAADIQVLDLHSDTPMFAYKGKVFEGQWARNLGTEVIFAERNDDENAEERPLPALRHLPGGVDMLAASWSRINTTEKRLLPKEEAATEDDRFKEVRRKHGIHIPITADKTGERKRQTRFLENLMALKKMRGETDEVTVYAHAAPRHINEGTTGRRKKRKALPDGRPRGRGRGGRGRGRGGSAAAAAAEGSGEPAAAGSGAEAAGDGTLSTPTPARWADLEGGDAADDKDVTMNDYDEASDDDSEDPEDAEE